jgi:hypothetical protein
MVISQSGKEGFGVYSNEMAGGSDRARLCGDEHVQRLLLRAE